jgi:glycosyltransferase involved in cell wall biosynthesis
VEVDVVPIEPGRQPDEHYHQQAEILNRADVVHIQHEHAFWGGILPGKSAFWHLRYLIRKPLVITAHTTTPLRELLRVSEERRPFHRIAKELLLLRRAYRDSVETAPFVTSRCIVHTLEAQQQLAARGAKEPHIHVIPAGIPAPVPAVRGGKLFRERYGPGPIVSLFGYLAPNKGYELVLKALPMLPHDVTIVFAGGARVAEMEPYARSVREAIDRCGAGQRVHITGVLTDDEVAEAMAGSDIVTAPHTQATGSYSVTVPLSYGKPVLASDLACFRELQQRGRCLETFPSGQADAFASALGRLLQNSADREKLAAEAQRFARQNTWHAVAQRTMEVYLAAVEDDRILSIGGRHP